MNGTYVYLLRSLRKPHKKYVGLTRDPEQRLAEHNTGRATATSRDRPWEVILSLCFADRDKAEAFETYLKRGSGHAFANRHFW